MQVEKVTNYVVNWLKQYLGNANMNGFVIGISGGIDSAVTSTLCAMTGAPTLCVKLPIHQDNSQVTRAQEHIEQLQERFPNASSTKINLTSVFEQFKEQTSTITDKNNPLLNLSLANTRARLRMTSLYYLAGLHKCLVAGTGNKVEDFGVGFFTKYGDGGVDLSPIADLMKSEVYRIGEHIQVPNSILVAAPTDGLFGDNRTDEDQIGASYDELEWAMKQQEEGKKIEHFNGREKDVYTIYLKRNKANKHKIDPIPVCKIPLKLKQS